MKLAPAKVMLAVSMGVYGYSLRDQAMPPDKPAGAAPAPAKELTAAMVNETVALSCQRDPFTGAAIKGSEPRKIVMQKAIKTLGPMALQGVSVGPDMRLAIINGVTFREGEPQAMEDGGPQICVKTIGLDYAIVHAGNRDTLLRLEQPKSEKDNDAAAAKPDAKTGTTGTNRPQGPSSAAKEEDPVEQLKHMVQQIQQLK